MGFVSLQLASNIPCFVGSDMTWFLIFAATVFSLYFW